MPAAGIRVTRTLRAATWSATALSHRALGLLETSPNPTRKSACISEYSKNSSSAPSPYVKPQQQIPRWHTIALASR
jgi:hypothetical protein